MNGVDRSVVPGTTLAQAASARLTADTERAEWLVSLHKGLTTPSDLLMQACTEQGRPLLKLTLRQVLINTPGNGDAKTAKTLERVRTILGADVTVRKMTVGWLLDSRAGGRRFMAWLDATTSLRSEPWPGFPYSSPLVNAKQSREGSDNRGNPL